MVSLMYDVAAYTGNSVLNYNLNYNRLLCLGYCEPGLLLQNFSTEICWVHCNTKSLTHQGSSKRFISAESVRQLIFDAKFHIYTTTLLNKISNT